MMNKIRLFFAGDICSKPSAASISVSDELKGLIGSCDVKVINFEVPLKPEGAAAPKGRERFFQHDDVPDFLRRLGFNVFSLANNHMFDWGDAGFRKTKEALGEGAFGAGTYEEAYTPLVVEVNGLKIGFLALSFAAYTGVFDDVTSHEGLGCAYLNDLRVNHDIMEARKQVDYLFVLPHDGIEYIDIPMPETMARYRDFIDYGADGVFGTHPHCPQGWEEYKGKPIFYSLGNFLFNSKEGYDYRATDKPHWYEGLGVVMTIQDGRLSWETVNTRNTGNTGIIIDPEEERNLHNETLCRYIGDKALYSNYLKNICKELGAKEMSIVDLTFHSRTLKACTRQLLHHWGEKIRKKDFTNDYALQRLLTHDARRHLLVWSIKKNNNHPNHV